uniref:G-protein coupled receptors family 1 profile domain-containing protein n=1 Tax=Setaria digitata TaxID=48799 RepID=A0A915PFR3_9BILA
MKINYILPFSNHNNGGLMAIATLYAFLFMLGTCGNAATLAVVYHVRSIDPRTRRNTTLTYISILSIVDFISMLPLPMTITDQVGLRTTRTAYFLLALMFCITCIMLCPIVIFAQAKYSKTRVMAPATDATVECLLLQYAAQIILLRDGWTPYWISVLYLLYLEIFPPPELQMPNSSFIYFMYGVHALPYINSASNFILYGLLNRQLHHSYSMKQSKALRKGQYNLVRMRTEFTTDVSMKKNSSDSFKASSDVKYSATVTVNNDGSCMNENELRVNFEKRNMAFKSQIDSNNENNSTIRGISMKDESFLDTKNLEELSTAINISSSNDELLNDVNL